MMAVPECSSLGLRLTVLRRWSAVFATAAVLTWGSAARSATIENFESYSPGLLSQQGWVFVPGQDGEIVEGFNGTKAVRPYNFYYMAGTRGAAGSPDGVFPSPISVASPGKAYFAAQMRPGMAGGYAPHTIIGAERADGGYRLAEIGITTADGAAAYDRKGRFFFGPADTSAGYASENIVMFDQGYQGYVFDIAVNLDIVSASEIYATLWYRNVSLGGTWRKSTAIDRVPFANTHGIENSARPRIVGYVRTEIDNFRMGEGHVGVSAVREDFESYQPGQLSSQGWVFSPGQDADIFKGTNGTQVAQTHNYYYMYGTHGASGSPDHVFPTEIDVSKPGKAYFSVQMRPGMAGGFTPHTVIGALRADGGYPLAEIGITDATNAVAYDRRGRFYFGAANSSSGHASEDVVLYDANYQGYLFDIAVNLDIVSATEIYATLSYRNVSLGGNWVTSSVLDRVPFDNTFGIQNAARTWMMGYVRTEIDNFALGMGQVGAALMKEDFEQYAVGQLSQQGWVFAAGQDADILAGQNGTKVAQAHNYYYMYGTHGAPGSPQHVYETGISTAQPGKAHFAAQLRPGMAGGYTPHTVIGVHRHNDGARLAEIGITTADGGTVNDRQGRFYFGAANGSSGFASENVVMYDEYSQGYIFDVAVNLEIVSSAEIYATLLYRNVSLGGGWVQSEELTHVPFDNTNGIENTGRTFLLGYVRTEIDNFRMGMGHVEGRSAAQNPFPPNGSSGVSPVQVLEWSKSSPMTAVEVYFGTDADAVAQATTESPEFMGYFDPAAGFDVTNYQSQGLTPGMTYYWRVSGQDPQMVSPVWSFTVNGGVLSSDAQQGELAVSPVYTPIVHQNHGMNSAPDLFGYQPRFQPGVVNFDAANRPYILTGEMSEGGQIVKGKCIQTRDAQGRWIGLDPWQSIKAAYPQWNGDWTPWDRNIVFDDDDDAYMIVKIEAGGHRTLLLHSQDSCWTWDCYELPVTAAWIYGARMETRKGFNQISGPPVIVGDADYLGGDLEIIVPQKVNGSLVIPDPVLITDDAPAWLMPSHSGASNVVVTRGSKSHIVWMTMESLPGYENRAPVYVATYDRLTDEVTNRTLLGFAPAKDEHDGPAITMDSQGYLHVIIGAHHDGPYAPFQYTRSLVANDSQGGWTPAAGIGSDTGYCYPALVCDADDTLHLVSRFTNGAYHFQLSYMYKPANGTWQYDTPLVEPGRAYYMCWYHELTLDRSNRLFLRYSTYVNQLDREVPGEIAAYEAKWPSEAPLVPVDLFHGTYNTRAHDPVVLVKSASENWRIATTPDFDVQASQARAPRALTAVSRKTHGNAGTFDIPVSIGGLPERHGIENRQGDPLEIVVRFNKPVLSARAVLVQGQAEVNGEAVCQENDVTISLHHVADAQDVVVELQDIIAADGGESPSEFVGLSVLAGDVNADGVVNEEDFQRSRHQIGMALTPESFSADLDANGQITAADLVNLRGAVGKTLP